jgi:hypothetical protein
MHRKEYTRSSSGEHPALQGTDAVLPCYAQKKERQISAPEKGDYKQELK